MKITPAILAQDYPELQSKLSRLKGFSRSVQMDVCDGVYTPKPSWPYINDRENRFQNILNQQEGLPLWDNFDFEIDMMVRYPEIEYEKWIDAGGSRIVVHHYLGQEERTKKTLDDIESRGAEAVIAFGFDDSISDIYKYDDLKSIQLMGIRKIGFQGQPFQPEILEKVAKLKEKFPGTEIAVDGGVNFDTAPLLAKSGADRLIVGSALFNSGDLDEAIRYFESL